MMNAKMIKDELAGFWTRYDELLDAIEQFGHPVEYATEEYIEISEADDDDAPQYILYLGWANGTMWIKDVKEA